MSRNRIFTLFFTMAVSAIFLVMPQGALAGKRLCGLDGLCATKHYQSHHKSYKKAKRHKHHRHHRHTHHAGRLHSGHVRVVLGGYARTRQVISCVRFNATAHGHTTHQAATLVSDTLIQSVYGNVGSTYHPANLQMSAPACGHGGGRYITCVQQARYCY